MNLGSSANIESTILPSKHVFINKKEWIKTEKVTFSFTAHTIWLKGLFYLLEAWNNMNTGEAELIVGGSIDPRLWKYLNLKKLITKNVHIIGHCKDMNKFYTNSDVFISPSLYDAGPATVAEAMYCGLPVIVSDGCGSKTLIEEGVNGFVVPAMDSEAIAQKVQWFIDNPDQIPGMGKNAAATIERLAKSDQNKDVANHIRQIIRELDQE